MARACRRRGRCPRRPGAGSSCGCDWPIGEHAVGPARPCRSPTEHSALRQRRVGAAVDDARTAGGAGRSTSNRARALLLVGLAGTRSRARRRAFARPVRQLAVPSRGAGYSSAPHGHLRPALRGPAGDRRARPPARDRRYDELADMLGDARGPRARAGPRRARRAGAGHRRSGRHGLARPARRLRARPADRARGHGHPRATCAAPRPPAPGRGRCSTRSSTLYEDEDLPRDPRRATRAPARERKPRRERGSAEEPRRTAEDERPAPAADRPTARAAVRRRPDAGGAAALPPAVVALRRVVLVWPVGVLTGGGDDAHERAADSSQPSEHVARRAAPVSGDKQRGRRRRGRRARQPAPADRAGHRCRPASSAQAYEVWLYNSRQRRQVARRAGHRTRRARYQGAGPLPSDYAQFKSIDISREPIDRNRRHSGSRSCAARIAPS